MSNTNKNITKAPAYSMIEGQSVSVFHEGKAYTVTAENAQFDAVCNCLDNENWGDLTRLLDLAEGLTLYMNQGRQGGFEVKGGVAYFNGEEVSGVVVDRIVQAMATGSNYAKRLTAFLTNLLANPSKHSVDQLYSFIEANGITLDENGFMLLYKAIRNDWMSKTACYKTGKRENNSIGAKPTMRRNEVVDDPNTHCAQGLHCGAIEYVRGFRQGDDRVVIVRVNPADVVSVPNDCSCQKIRVATYEVLAEYEGDLPPIACTQWDNSPDEDEDDYDYSDDEDGEWEDDEFIDFAELDKAEKGFRY